MAQIIYEIVDGLPDFTVSLTPPVLNDQIQTAIGTYDFGDVPTGTYTLTVVDSQGCTDISTDIKIFNICTDANLHFNTYSNYLIGLLTIGSVIANINYIVGNYVIDWYLGGNIVLTTGVGSDPDIQALHPFINEPVQSGNLHPVIRWIEINGIIYSPNVELGLHSPDLIFCLPETNIHSVNVTEFNCSNGVNSGSYSHKITYVNNIDPAINAERTIKFILSQDGSTNYFAWFFNAYYVADRISLFYVNIEDENNPILIEDWILGYYLQSDFISTPKKYNSSLKIVSDLTGFIYHTNDYILIRIIPRVVETTNVNTNWELQMQCLTTFDPYTAPVGIRTPNPSTVTMLWNTITCEWEASWYNVSKFESNHYTFAYLQLSLYGFTYNYYNLTTGKLLMNLKKKRDSVFNTVQGNVCINAVGNIHIVKTGSNVLYTFDNITDYDTAKYYYDRVLTYPQWTDYTADNTSILHYKFWYLLIREANSCGDTFTNTTLLFHRNSSFVWNPTNMTLSINMVNAVNGFTNIECDTTFTNVSLEISSANSLINQLDFDKTTKVMGNYFMGGHQFLTTNLHEMNESFQKEIGFLGNSNSELFHAGQPTDFMPSVGGNLGYQPGYAVFKITNVTDPLNNFRLTNFLNEDGTYKTVGEIFYEKQNGIVIIPAP